MADARVEANPVEGPEDEDEPLLPPKASVVPNRKLLICGSALVISTFVLLITTVSFGALYYHQMYHRRLPKWPKPSMSPLGKYEKASVAADNEYCSEIGRDVLLRGGNAVDAAIAALFCIGVMDTHSAGLGGGHLFTVYNATTQRCHVVDARETAPAAATENMYKGRWNESQLGWKAVAVPGELHGLWTEYRRFGGKLAWKELVLPTIRLVEEGYPTSHALAKALRQQEFWIRHEPTMRRFINKATNKTFAAGEQIHTRDNFLETLRLLANSSDPVKTFYEGSIAEKVVKEFAANGGLLTLDDFKNYRAIIRDDDDVIYTKLANGRHICGPPPPSGAAVAQAILNILDGYTYNMSSFSDISLLYHHFIEASKFAYAGRSLLGDMNFVKNATELAKNMTSPEWATQIRSKITEKTHPDAYYGGDFGVVSDHGTTNIAVIDAEGNAVTVTSTINLLMGAGVMSEETGILWNDEMDDFSTPGHPNAFGFPPSPANFIRPGKRPMSSMSPLIIYSDNDHMQKMAVGGAGGSTIISGVAGVALHALWLNANVKEAVDSPRLHNQLQPNVTQYEENFPQAYIDSLSDRGHTMVPVKNLTVVTAVEKALDGLIYANSDFRKGEESAPAGY